MDGRNHRSPAFRRIVITADLLRPFPREAEWESATWKNARWLHHLLEPALRRCGFEPSLLSWDERALPGRGRGFETPLLYHRLGRDVSLESWAQLARSTPAPQALVQALEPEVADALVIGYEMPEVMIDALQRLGRPFVDVVLHPWRFMPDLVFALRSNVAGWQAQFRRLRLSAASVEEQASLIQAKSAWMPRGDELPPGTVLVLGQVPTDRAMVTGDGRFAALDQHLERLHGLCCDHPLVLFRPHPYAQPDDPSSRAVGQLPAIRTTDANFYQLLCQPELEGVVALNSSGLLEARAFGRVGENLIPFLYDFDDDAPTGEGAVGAPVPLPGIWTRPAFWQGLLDEDAEAVDRAEGHALAPNALRRSMNADWGYGHVERVCA